MKTIKEIQKLREAFRIEYEKFRKIHYDLGIRLADLVKQADLLLGCMEELNKFEEGLK